MTPKQELMKTDLVVRFDPATRSISFHGINSGTAKPLATAIHTIDWPKGAPLSALVDVGAAVCARLFASFPGMFCSEVEWDDLATQVRRATGRDQDD
jgi:hypothetical protein